MVPGGSSRAVVGSHRTAVLRTLLSRLQNAGQAPRLLQAVATATEQAHLRRELGVLAAFEPSNPTGSYSLRLNQLNDRSLLKELLGINSMCIKDLASIPMRLRRGDTSQYGDRSCFRNVRRNGKPFRIKAGVSASELEQGGCSTLEFDFVSTIRPS